MKKVPVNIRKFSKDTTISVKLIVTKEFKVRMLIVKGLIKLIGLVLGCSFAVKEN